MSNGKMTMWQAQADLRAARAAAHAETAAAIPYGDGDIGVGRWPEAHKKLDSGEIIEITQEFFDYFLGVLPPVHMGAQVMLANGMIITSAFGFAEGAELVRAFWTEGPKFYAAQTRQMNPNAYR